MNRCFLLLLSYTFDILYSLFKKKKKTTKTQLVVIHELILPLTEATYSWKMLPEILPWDYLSQGSLQLRAPTEPSQCPCDDMDSAS